jgi:peptidoglycan/LPS O-acetylase OafA/YrhL
MPARRGVRLDHIPALDGLRGVAVLGVLLFHGGALVGGYMGVDLFFVLSGFLITSLLVVEWDSTGTISLREFWKRRARRLLPAVFGLLAFVVVLAVVFAKSTELGAWRLDGIATLFYGANWRQIASGTGYWDQFAAPSPLRHTWSLAIEEQFYLVWPLVVLGLMKLTGGSKKWLLGVAAGGAFVSATVMLLVWNPDDPNRAYLGTDTRAAAVLVGATLAVAFRMWGPVKRHGRRVALENAALVALAALVLVWCTVDGTSAGLYHYGFLACGLAAALVIAASIQPVRGPLGAALSFAPLRWIGLISYGLYLWHWPIYVVLDANRLKLGLDGWALLTLKLALSLAFAVVSYYVLERPIRRRGLAAWPRPALLPAAGIAVVLALFWVTFGATDQPAVATGTASADAAPAGATVRSELPTVADDPVASDPAQTTTTVMPPPSGPIPRPPGRLPRVMVVGDSVGYWMGDAMTKQAKALNLDVANRAMFACPLTRDSLRVRDGGEIITANADCARWPEFWKDDINRYRPDVVLVMFGGPPPTERDIDGGWYGPCSAQYDQWFSQNVGDAIDLLASRGAMVFVAPAAYARFPFMDFSKLDPLTDCMNRDIDGVVRTHPKSRELPIDKFICPGRDDCVEFKDGVNLREDGIHYTGDGAVYMSRWVTAQMVS